MRECTLSTLDAWLGAAHLDKMVCSQFWKIVFRHPVLGIAELIVDYFLQLPYVTAVLTDAKIGAEGRKDLFDWLSRQLAGMTEYPDAIQLLKPTASAMTVFLPAMWLFHSQAFYVDLFSGYFWVIFSG